MLRGMVFMANLDGGVGSVQNKPRPVVIIQNNIGNKFSPTVICAALTTKLNKRDMPTHVVLPKEIGLKYDSCVLTEQVLTIDKSQLVGNSFCTVPDQYMRQIDKALIVSFGIEEMKEHNADMDIIQPLVDILYSNKVSKKTLFNIFVRYCKSFGLNHRDFKPSQVAA